MKKIFNVVLVLCFIIVGPSVDALGNNKEKTKVKKEKIYVEVLYNNGGTSKIEETILDDGTKVGEYDYEVLYATPLSMNVLENRISTYSTSSPIGDYFDYAAWITRDGEVSLSLDPKTATRGWKPTSVERWSALANPYYGYGSIPNWTTKEAFYWQYECHFENAPHKDRWNIEPWRTASSYMHVVLKGCNPE